MWNTSLRSIVFHVCFSSSFSIRILLSSTTTHITGALTKRAQLLLSQVPADIVRTEILLVSVVVLAVKMTFDFDGEYIKAWLRAWSVYWPSDTPWVDAFVFSFHQILIFQPSLNDHTENHEDARRQDCRGLCRSATRRCLQSCQGCGQAT